MTSTNHQVLLEWLRHCAEQGQFCPTNDAICERFGYLKSPSAVRLMKLLEDEGAIKIERLHMGRVVTIVATGKSTARPAPSKPKAQTKARKVDVPPPALKWQPSPEIVHAAALDGRPLGEFAGALIQMGLDCWRDDRILSGEPVDTSTAERKAA